MRRFAILAFLLAAPTAFAQSLAVSSSVPANNAVSAPRSGPVRLTFTDVLDPTTVTPAAVRVAGRWSGPVPGSVGLSVDRRTVTFTPARPFQAGEAVTVQITRSLRAATGASVGAGRGLTFWAAAAPGSLAFPEVARVPIRRPGEDNIVTYGGASMDLNGDRFPDFVVTNEATSDVRAFLGDPSGRYSAFTVVRLPQGSVPSPLEPGDFNGDGHMDLAVANVGGSRVSVLLGDGAGGFPQGASYLSGQTVRAISSMDVDGDGQDDLITGNRSARTVTVLRGAADGTFGAAVAIPAGPVEPHSLAVADMDEDGRLDAVVGDFGAQALLVLRNDGAGGFAPAGRIAFTGSPWMIAAGDIDRDGHADIAVAGSFAGVVQIAWGDGAGGFSGTTELTAGNFLVAIDLGDLDGDGDLDVVSSNYGSRNYALFETRAGRQFAPRRLFPVAGGASCMTLHDRDDDGDLDMTGIDEVDDLIYLYDNTGAVAGADAPVPGEAFVRLAGSNPARGTTRLAFGLAQPGPARLTLTDVLGREVGVAFDGTVGAGEQTVSVDVAGLAPGVYTARLSAEGAVRSVRLTVAQ
ncbi:MAG TPA: FG-GAP-like repeat-containing protein [Rubricoccaceae bacterium]